MADERTHSRLVYVCMYACMHVCMYVCMHSICIYVLIVDWWLRADADDLGDPRAVDGALEPIAGDAGVERHLRWVPACVGLGLGLGLATPSQGMLALSVSCDGYLHVHRSRVQVCRCARAHAYACSSTCTHAVRML